MNPSSRFGKAAIGVGAALKLRGAARRLFSLLPDRVRSRIKRLHQRLSNWQLTRDLERGRELVPKEALEHRYRELLAMLLEGHEEDELGDYIEFGVCKGTSLACMYRALESMKLEHVRLFGFDSFEGLPASASNDEDGVWWPGQFRYREALARKHLTEQGVNWDRVTISKGWFSDTLTDDFAANHQIKSASIIMIDCDLYLSAQEALTFCAPLLGERAVILFDDWNAAGLADRNLGEKRAFDEFLVANPDLTARRLGGYHAYAEVFMVQRSITGAVARDETVS